MAEVEQAVAAVLDEHFWFPTTRETCYCGWQAERLAHDYRRGDFARHVAAEIAAALAPLLAAERARALDEAADALAAQPPKLKAQYVAAFRLYANEPWRSLDRRGLGHVLEGLLSEHWPDSGVNPWYLADLLREQAVAIKDVLPVVREVRATHERGEATT